MLVTKNTFLSYLNAYSKEVTFITLLKVAFIAAIIITLVYFIIKFKRRNKHFSENLLALYGAAKKPLFTIIIIYACYFGILGFESYYSEKLSGQAKEMLGYLLGMSELLAIIWLASNLITLAKKKLLRWAIDTKHTAIQLNLPAISDSFSAAVFLLMLNLFVPALYLRGIASEIMEKTLKVLFIMTLGWIFLQIVNILENIIINRYVTQNEDLILTRKIRTQVTILKRILYAMIVIITLATTLMVFDSVKSLGAGILTTAGLISAIGAFASQQTLGRLFSGLQLAFTQPIRIGDTVIIDNEFGQIEEINLSYVTVKLWDLRRLIKPTDYFTNQGVLNLTRESSQLLGTVFIYSDYTLPIDSVRKKFMDFLHVSSYWDKNVSALEVTDITEKCIQLRALVSAENSSMLWKLRCEIREKLVTYIVNHFPHCLPITREISPPLAKEG